MPVDNKRLPTPEESKTPYLFKNNQHETTELVNAQKIRQDGRHCDQARPIFIKCGTVKQAKGSAYIEMQQTKVLCAVYGPREVTRREDFSMRGQLMCDVKFATFSGKQRRGHQSDVTEKSCSLLVRDALEPAVLLDKFPKARIEVFILVLQDDGSALAASINSASVALASAGIEMYDIVVACAMRTHGNLCLFDPTKSEEYSSKTKSEGRESEQPDGSITVGFMPSLNQISSLLHNGHMTVESVKQGVQFGVDQCQKIYPVLQHCLQRDVRGRLDTK